MFSPARHVSACPDRVKQDTAVPPHPPHLQLAALGYQPRAAKTYLFSESGGSLSVKAKRQATKAKSPVLRSNLIQHVLSSEIPSASRQKGLNNYPKQDARLVSPGPFRSPSHSFSRPPQSSSFGSVH